jgi:excisionase family DNA binding protein
MGWLSTREAALRLDVSEQHVRRLVRAGELPSQQISGRWLIDSHAVGARERVGDPSGRPPAPRTAWAVLRLLVAAAQRDDVGAWSALDDRRLRFRLHALLDGAPPVESWSRWLRRRAAIRRVWMHEGVLERFSQDQRVSVTGDHAAALGGVGIAAGPGRRFYVAAAEVTTLVQRYRAQDAVDGQVELLVVPPGVPAGMRPSPGQPVPPVVALVDLLDSPDARQHGIALDVVGAAARRLRRSPAVS